MDRYILKRVGCSGSVGDDFEEHGSAVLIEEFWGGVYVVVCSGVGAADDHYGVAGCAGGGRVVDTVVVDGGLEEVGVFF